MHTALALLSAAAGAMLLIWLVMRNLETGVSTAKTVGLVAMSLLLLMLTAVLLVMGPVSTLKE